MNSIGNQSSNDNGRAYRLQRREVVATKRKAESRALNSQRRRIGKRAAVGADWDGSAANDNIAWPMAVQLIREGNTELLKYAMMYRRVHDQAKSDAKLGGASIALGNGVALDQRQWIKPNGEIAYKGVRKVANEIEETPSRRKTPADSEKQLLSEKADSGWSSVPKQWNGDRPVNDMIDAKRWLTELRKRLGHLCEPFELACIDGATLQAVGNAAGVANRAGAMGAGRVLVHTALVTLRDCMGPIGKADLVDW